MAEPMDGAGTSLAGSSFAWNVSGPDLGAEAQAISADESSTPAIRCMVPPRTCGSGRHFGREDVDLLDARRLGEQLGSLGHQRRGDGARQMRLARCVVGECVEDAELPRP